ncbi:hypothetical protein Misp01_31970 [Microtetraspora sp. NBRC 13810]|uniref:hypothetical protein n=1 Tax=Microtetraspora sp. NBRC 13810 TaxID=3030990 RepID=UPI0024A58C2C|nr:hypothetical protein [Microtetraspora sp. NBRC 13810]GLW08067.1 hypothetical protein Misp01_31970 [Microtetraspora sp. NBRC 13810]
MSSEPGVSAPGPVAEAGAADLLIVADPADEVAAEVAGYVGEHGRTALVVDVFDAAQLFTVSVRDGVAEVEPDRPLLLRLPSPPSPRISFDAEFQYNECLAQLWAAAALMTSPVVNRPSAYPAGGRTSPSAALTELRADEEQGGVEVFTSKYPVPGTPEGERLWVEDLGTLRTSPWPERPAGAGPYRARWSDADPAFEMVVVLSGRAWRCTTADLGHLGLEERSVAVAAALDLDLAAIVWRVTEDAGRARLVNVEPFPGLEQLRMVWLGFGPRLLEVLFP